MTLTSDTPSMLKSALLPTLPATNDSGLQRLAPTTDFPSAAASRKPTNAFIQALNSFHSKATPMTPAEEHAHDTKVAGDLVSQALILPVMKQMRRSVWSQNDIFGGGTGEKTFGPEFDTAIADRLAHSPRMTVTASLAQRLYARSHPELKATRNPTQGLTKNAGVDING